MRTIKFFVTVCCLVLAACTEHNPDFPFEETVKQELMPLQGITNGFSMDVKHPFLIYENWERQDSLYHIYDLNTHELKSVFGIQGRGPGEFVYAALFDSQRPDVFIVDVQNKCTVYRYGIDADGQLHLKDTRVPNYIKAFEASAIINDSIYVRDDWPVYNLELLSLGDDLPRKTWEYAKPLKTIIPGSEDPEWGRLAANEERIFRTYGTRKQIDFLNTDLEPIKRMKFKDKIRYNGYNRDRIPTGYRSCYAGKKYFYALYIEIPLSEYSYLDTDRSTMEVFDMDGNPVAKYHLEGMLPLTFVVDEETFTVYGFTYPAVPEDKLLVYRLKGLS